MRGEHAVFGGVEEMVEQVLVPGGGVSGGEAAHTDGEEVHVEERYLGPGVEGWGEAEGWIERVRVSFTLKFRGTVPGTEEKE